MLVLKIVNFLKNKTLRSVTTQMKALDEYLLMVVFMLLQFWTEKYGSERIKSEKTWPFSVFSKVSKILQFTLLNLGRTADV